MFGNLGVSKPKPLSGGFTGYQIFLPSIFKPEVNPVVDIPFASKEEEWVYTQLLIEQDARTILKFKYQEQVFGGRLVRGGQVLDFVVWNPRPTVIFVNGSRWHTGFLGSEEFFKQQMVRRAYPTVVTFWSRDMPDKDSTMRLTHEWVVVRAGQSKE